MVSAESDEASRVPSGLTARAWTWVAWALSRMIGWALVASQTRTVVSQPAEYRRGWFGCQARAGMRSLWPEKVMRGSPLEMSHRWIIFSSPAETSDLPSVEKARALTPLCAP